MQKKEEKRMKAYIIKYKLKDDYFTNVYYDIIVVGSTKHECYKNFAKLLVEYESTVKWDKIYEDTMSGIIKIEEV